MKPRVLLALLLVAPIRAAGEQPSVDRLASDLKFPTNIAFAPDGRLFFTEKNTGRVRIIEDERLVPDPFVTLPVARAGFETGLLGIALDPSFPSEPWVYVYYTAAERNLLVRVRAEGNHGTQVQTVLEGLPVTRYHDGGEMTFGPDGKLYVAVGESHRPELAQDPDSIGGKVLRLNPDGTVPPDNPFGPRSPVYSMGHRNSFGLCFDPETGNLWQTENGPREQDEVNLIEPGGNYGWPDALGTDGPPRFIDPVLAFPEVIVPTGCAFYTAPHLGPRAEGALLFGDYAHGTLHLATLSLGRRTVRSERAFLTGLPPIIDVQMGPDGRLYVATSESILRLPRRVPRSPPPSPSRIGGALPTAPLADERSSLLLWIVAGAAGAAVGAGLLVRLRGRPSP